MKIETEVPAHNPLYPPLKGGHGAAVDGGTESANNGTGSPSLAGDACSGRFVNRPYEGVRARCVWDAARYDCDIGSAYNGRFVNRPYGEVGSACSGRFVNRPYGEVRECVQRAIRESPLRRGAVMITRAGRVEKRRER